MGGLHTLIGGTGNDTLIGGEGSNVFVYASGGGNDVITNYKSGDVIQVSGTVGSATFNSVSGNYVFTVGTGKITVKTSRKNISTSLMTLVAIGILNRLKRNLNIPVAKSR